MRALCVIIAAAHAYEVPTMHTPRIHRRAAVPVMQSLNEDILTTLSKLEGDAAAAAAETKERKEAERALQQQKVSAFGARLDDDIAGQDVTIGGKKSMELHERNFEMGNKLMLRGEYKEAVKMFTQATVNAPGGLTGRRGGQYAVYLAQALQAANRRDDAARLLQKCEAHPDQDVRKIAESVLYIMQAPELKLDADQFVSITMPDEDDMWGPRRMVKKPKDPPPEKYSLEWYVLEAEKRKNAQPAEPVGGSAALAASGLLLCGAFGVLLTRG